MYKNGENLEPGMNIIEGGGIKKKLMIKDIILLLMVILVVEKVLLRLLAKNLNFKYLDSGAMYRAVTLYFVNKGVSQNDTKKIKDELNNIIIDFKYVEDNQHIFLNDQDVKMK